MPTVGAPLIPGFFVEGVLGRGATSTVYRATRGGRSYAIKLLTFRENTTTSDELLRFAKEAATIAKLSHPGLTKLHEVGEVDGLPYLVMDLVTGNSLAEEISKGRLSDNRVIELALQLAATLDYFHSRGVVHKDLKPENVLVDSSGVARVIDFGFAPEQSDFDGATNDGVLGTLLYSSPEQNGLLKQPVDNRSDLYDLGGVLYHCLTGKPVFESQVALTLMIMHLTAKPVAPTALLPALRPALSAMILKLLAKDPDDRYQGASGLIYDLRNLGEIERSGEPFLLGTHDSGLRIVESPIVGRDEELATLFSVRAQALARQGSVLLIAGEGGSGKTRLVRELVRSQKSEDFLILTSKAKQGETVPFGPLREAIDALLSRLEKDSPSERKRITQALTTAAGDLAAIIRRLSPGLQKLFKDAKEIPPLDGNAEQERFYLKVAEFFVTLSQTAGPVLLLIDDIQWLDNGTLEILKQLSRQINSAPFLLAATARDDSRSQTALTAFVDAVNSTHLTQLTQLTLTPLKLPAVGELVCALLGGKPLEESNLASTLTDKFLAGLTETSSPVGI